MRQFDITISRPEHVGMLANITNRYPFTITLRQGRYMVDGKSLLGIYSLELAKGILLEAWTDHCEELARDLHPLLD